MERKHVGLVSKCNSNGIGRIFCWDDKEIDVGGKVMIKSDWTNQEVICEIKHGTAHAPGFNPLLALKGIEQVIKPHFMLDFEVLKAADGSRIIRRLLPPHSKVFPIK